MAGRAVPGPSVTSRVFDLLEAFDDGHRSLTLSQLSRRAALPLTTTHRLTTEMLARGVLDRDDSGTFHIGLRLWEMGALAPASLGLREATLPYLEDLYEATHENVQLAVLDGHEAVYVERLSGRESVHVITRLGSRLPVHATGVGLVLLAHAPRDVSEEILRSTLIRYTKFTITDPRRLRRMLADVRAKGFAISDRQIELISISVAAPIRDATGSVVAALSLVAASGGNDPLQFVSAVLTAARGASRNLTARGTRNGQVANSW